MIAYVTLGTNDLPRAAEFYDALLAQLGAGRAMAMDRMIVYASAAGSPMLAVCTPYDCNAATTGNGVMVALAAGSREGVDALHASALGLGASDEGAPGERMPGFYGAYFRDLDGNKLCACHFG